MTIITNETIGARVREARKDVAGISLKSLGDKVGKSKQNLSNIENGSTSLSLALAYKIASACGVSVDYLVQLPDVPTIITNDTIES